MISLCRRWRQWRAAAEAMLADPDALADAKARRDAEDRREYLAESRSPHRAPPPEPGIPEVVLQPVAAEACGQWWRHLGKPPVAVVPSGLCIPRRRSPRSSAGWPARPPTGRRWTSRKRVLCFLGGVVDLREKTTTPPRPTLPPVSGGRRPGRADRRLVPARPRRRPKPRQEVLLTTPCLVIE